MFNFKKKKILNDIIYYNYVILNEKFHKRMPYILSRFFSRLNGSFNNNENIKLVTVDGSNQVVHPDIISYQGKFWMVLTPYPYGVDLYENPIIYVSHDLEEWNLVSKDFIIKENKIGCHLSDPCLAIIENKMYLFFRRTNKIEGTSEILFMNTEDAIKWSTPQKLIDPLCDSLMSPAIIRKGEKNKIFLVNLNREKNNSNLVMYDINEKFNLGNRNEISVCEMPESMYIWHITIKKIDNEYKGLFLLKDKNKMKFSLYCAEPENNVLETWSIKNKIEIKNESIEWLYKAAFGANENEIIYSYRNTNRQWGISKQKIN